MSAHEEAVRLARRHVEWLDALAPLPQALHEGSTESQLARAVVATDTLLAQYRPVVDAACAWRVGRDRNIVGTAPPGGQRSATGVALIEAIDALTAERHQ